jgi:hypothetical protein
VGGGGEKEEEDSYSTILEHREVLGVDSVSRVKLNSTICAVTLFGDLFIFNDTSSKSSSDIIPSSSAKRVLFYWYLIQ